MERKGFHRILLATDGGGPAESALRLVALMASSSRATVRVVHVWDLELHQRHRPRDVEMRHEARGLIDEAVTRLRAVGIDAQGELMHADAGHIALAVAEAANDFEADLVVVGSRGLNDWQSMLKHSVSHQVLGAVDCPVLIVRGQPPADVNDPKRVLLAVAGGDDVIPGVRAAAAAARAPGSEVMVVHVAQAIFGAQGFAYVEPPEEVTATMTEATALLTKAGVKAEAMVAPSGPVAAVVAEIAGGWRADLIVTASSRIGDLGSILFGSVTHQLLHAISTPVLVAERPR